MANRSDPSTISSDQGRDRRCHYRVNDQLKFEFKLIDPKTMRLHQAEDLFERRSELDLMAELSKLEEESQVLLRDIASEHRSIGIYLSLLNRKTQLIAQHVCTEKQHNDLSEVNLSEGGLAFLHDAPLNVGDHMAIQLSVTEEAWQVHLYGRIVRCLSAVPKGHQIAVAFCEMDNHQQKLLTRRVFKIQMQSHRKKD